MKRAFKKHVLNVDIFKRLEGGSQNYILLSVLLDSMGVESILRMAELDKQLQIH